MATKKKAKKAEEKMYSFDEYRKTFGTAAESDYDDSDGSPKVFGMKLAEEALKKVRQEAQEKRASKLPTAV